MYQEWELQTADASEVYPTYALARAAQRELGTEGIGSSIERLV